MSIVNKAMRAVVLGAIALGVAALIPIMALSRESERELRIVVLDRAFYLEGQTQANPTLALRAGERVRLVLRNEDDGMRHDFAIRAWGVAVPPIEGRGQRAITFRVPDRHGQTTYNCTPHPVSMRGAITVE